MPKTLKSEAYYLTHDPVIRRWENKTSLYKCAQSLRLRLQCTGHAYTNIFMVTVTDNDENAVVTACGRTFTLECDFVCNNLEHLLALQYDHSKFQKYLAQNSVNK